MRRYGIIGESTGIGNLEEAERYFARRLEKIRQASDYGVGPGRTFRETAEHYAKTRTKRSLGRDLHDWRIVLPYIGDSLLQQIHDRTVAHLWRLDRRMAGLQALPIERLRYCVVS